MLVELATKLYNNIYKYTINYKSYYRNTYIMKTVLTVSYKLYIYNRR